MRFAYIDSQGNEVPIPSVDALALRIELGAVGPDTQLYDAQADHWGPANTHEIFHTLSRDSGDEGFLAPPPPVAPAPPAAAGKPKAAKPKPAPPPEPEEEDEEGAFDLGLTLAEPQPDAPAKRRGEDDRAIGDIATEAAVAPELSLAESAPLDLSEPEEEEEGDAGGGFDFGDIGGGLEMEAPAVEPDSDMGVEAAMEFGAPAASFDAGGDDLVLEEPMSSFEPDSPPGWMEESGADDVMDFSAVGTEEDVEDAVAPVADASPRQRRTPKDRPSKPRFKSQRSMSGPIFFVVLLIALGVGGYYGWPFLQQYLESRNAPARPAVVMPNIPAELLPRMQSIANTAIGDVVGAVDRATRSADAPTEPDQEWLAGVYLGNASQYPGVAAFWESIESFLAGLRDAEWQGYHDAFAARAANEGLEAQGLTQVTERADSGFVAAQPQRMAALGEMERLVDASLDLHDFLLANESEIDFRPGVTSASDPNVDPVLEISAPADDRERMNELFLEITEALDALGSLDRVTRDRLVSGVTARLQQVGIQ
jgi:hypothetical protein